MSKYTTYRGKRMTVTSAAAFKAHVTRRRMAREKTARKGKR